MATAQNPTRLEQLIDPEVLADMLPGRLAKKIRFREITRIDNTLVATPGSTITIPRYGHIGEAQIVPEGGLVPYEKLATETVEYTVRKIAIGVEITDEALLSAYARPADEAARQIVTSIASKIDNMTVEQLYEASRTVSSGGIVSYYSLVKAIDEFEEEENSRKVMFIHPRQMTQIRLDELFLSADKYPDRITVSGAIGRVANTDIVVSKKVTNDGGKWLNPIVKLEADAETEYTEAESPAITYFRKRAINPEFGRDMDRKIEKMNADEHGVVALTNDEKVIIAAMDTEEAAG